MKFVDDIQNVASGTFEVVTLLSFLQFDRNDEKNIR